MSKNNNKNCYDKNNLKETPEFIEFKNRCIDDFIKRLSISAMYYGIHIDTVYEQKKDILEIYSYCDRIVVHTKAIGSFIMMNNLALPIILEEILNTFIKAFEDELRNKESEIDEHWEHMPY